MHWSAMPFTWVLKMQFSYISDNYNNQITKESFLLANNGVLIYRLKYIYGDCLGLILISGPRNKSIKVGNHIIFILPNKAKIETENSENRPLREFFYFNWRRITKKDVPIGTEVWLNE